MKKKNVLFFVLILLTFFYGKTVNAMSVNVCDSGCEYTSINDALTYYSNNFDPKGNREALEIHASTSEEQILTDHTLNFPVILSFDYSAGVLNGDGATLTTNQEIAIYGENVDIKNLNIYYNGGSFFNIEESPDYVDSVLYLNGQNMHLDSVNVVSQNSITCPNYPMGINSNCSNLAIENSTVRNFFIGIATGGNLAIDYCTLNDNYVSVASYGNGSITHSYLGRMFTNGNFEIDETNEIGNMRVKINRTSGLDDSDLKDAGAILKRVSGAGIDKVKEDEEAALSPEAMCAMIEEPAIYVSSTGPNVSIHLKKNMEVNLNKQTSVEDVLGMFVEDNTLYDGFEFTSSDESIATVVNNKVKLLKAGDVTITAVNDYTNEEYTLVITAYRSTNNPLTYRNSVYVLLGVATLGLISLIFSTIRRVVKEH